MPNTTNSRALTGKKRVLTVKITRCSCMGSELLIYLYRSYKYISALQPFLSLFDQSTAVQHKIDGVLPMFSDVILSLYSNVIIS